MRDNKQQNEKASANMKNFKKAQATIADFTVEQTAAFQSYLAQSAASCVDEDRAFNRAAYEAFENGTDCPELDAMLEIWTGFQADDN